MKKETLVERARAMMKAITPYPDVIEMEARILELLSLYADDDAATHRDEELIRKARTQDLEHRLAEAEQKEQLHWAAYVGAKAMLQATKEREYIAQSNRENALKELASLQRKIALVQKGELNE